MGDGIDGRMVPGLVRRVRRVADLSQRDLAARFGVSQSTVARWETGEREPTLRQFLDLVGLAGARLTITSSDEVELTPMRADAVRDNAGRRYPAHHDVEAIDRTWRPRWDRPHPTHGQAHRRVRDERRARAETVPVDHPSAAEVRAALARRREEREARLRALYPGWRTPGPPVEFAPCTCPIECEETGVCSASCPCGCERVDDDDG